MRNVRAWFALTACTLTLSAAALGALGRQAGSAPESSPAAILERYRSGDADAAIRAVVALDENALRRFIDRSPDPDDPWDGAALALLHAEVANRVDTIGADGHPSNVRTLHHRREWELIDRACRKSALSADAALAGFCRGWTLVRASTEIARRLPDTPDTLIALGAASERSIGPYPQPYSVGLAQTEYRWYPETGCPIPTSSGCITQSAYTAIQYYSRALDIDATAVEARLRRGRVLAVLDKTDDAERDLAQAARDAQARQDRPRHYLALLLLGHLSERAGQPEAALARYRAAQAVAPEFPAAAVAAARLRVLAGDAENAAADLARVLEPDPGTSEPGPPDPWTRYVQGMDPRELSEALAALRAAVRR